MNDHRQDAALVCIARNTATHHRTCSFQRLVLQFWHCRDDIGVRPLNEWPVHRSTKLSAISSFTQFKVIKRRQLIQIKLILCFVSDEALPPVPSSSCHSSDTAAGELFFCFSKKFCDFLQFFVFDRQNMRRRRWKSRPTQIADWS